MACIPLFLIRKVDLMFDSQLAQIASQIAMRIHINTPLVVRSYNYKLFSHQNYISQYGTDHVDL